MKATPRRFAAFGFVVCLGTLSSACSPRTTPPAVPAPPQADRPPDPPQAAPVTPETPASRPATSRPRSEAGSDECALIAAPGEPVATVALAERVDPSHAPRPSNESERLLFRQLYETLLRIDCMGRVGPGLAASWRLDADGRTWLVTLRQDARFADGSPVTSTDVRAGWTAGGSAGELRPGVSRLVESVVPISSRELAVTLRSHRTDVPFALAHSDLAVARLDPGSPWPLGTRASRIAADGDHSRGAAASAVTVTRDNLPPVRFLVAPGDSRDSLDRGVDLLLTRDPMALEYAATLPQFQSVAMAWRRVHVLLTPGRARSAPSLSEDARQALAADAVRGEARGARGPFWWEMLTDCEIPESPSPSRPSFAPRIVYDAGDGAARDIAERLVGLARGSTPATRAVLDALLPDRPRRKYERANGVTGEALTLALRRGNDAGYVFALDSRPVDACGGLQTLMDDARWLDPETIVPLIETRMHAIVRRGRSGLAAEWDGGVVIAGPGGPR